jgi:hypothetical protein
MLSSFRSRSASQVANPNLLRPSNTFWNRVPEAFLVVVHKLLRVFDTVERNAEPVLTLSYLRSKEPDAHIDMLRVQAAIQGFAHQIARYLAVVHILDVCLTYFSHNSFDPGIHGLQQIRLLIPNGNGRVLCVNGSQVAEEERRDLLIDAANSAQQSEGRPCLSKAYPSRRSDRESQMLMQCSGYLFQRGCISIAR